MKLRTFWSVLDPPMVTEYILVSSLLEEQLRPITLVDLDMLAPPRRLTPSPTGNHGSATALTTQFIPYPNQWGPFINEVTDGNVTSYRGMCVESMEVLAFKLNFTYVWKHCITRERNFLNSIVLKYKMFWS